MAGDIAGAVFNDINGNGANDKTDPGLSGWTVFVDTNNDGRLTSGEPTAVTDVKGKYAIVGVPAGNVNVYEVVQSSFKPAPGFMDHVLFNVRDNRVNKLDFPNVTAPITTGRIVGTTFDDPNQNGIKESGEHGLAGWTMFVDTNSDGLLTAGEITATTNADGDFVLDNVPTGNATVYEIPQDGFGPVSSGLFPLDTAVKFKQVSVAAGGSVRADFANVVTSVGTIQGNAWDDANGDGVHQATEANLIGRPVFVDTNDNGLQDAGEPVRTTDATGAYSFVNIRSGSYTVVEVLPVGYIATLSRPSTMGVFVSAGSTNTLDFYNLIPTSTSSIRGNVWNDVNSDGVLTAPEPGIEGWKVYVDLNANNVLDTTDPQATTDASGNYAINGLPYGMASIQLVPHAGYTSTTPATIVSLILNGENRVGVNFGNHEPLDFSIGGIVFSDANKDGVRDPSEVGVSGVMVFLDANSNGVLDAGEPSTASSVDLFYTPATNELGTYSFTHLARGTYHVVEVVPALLSGTPDSVRTNIVTIGPNSPADVNFADQYRPSEIHGIVYDDTNANHQLDGNEYARPGIPVFIDVNRDDIYEIDEPRTITGPDGSYSFAGLGTGAYIVREDSGSLTGPHTYPTTGGGILWPSGISHPAIGNVTPTSITTSLENGQTYLQTVSLTLPGTGTITNLVDVFLLFDDTGSFTSNSPIVRAAFPTIINSLQTSLPGIDLGFGVGRFEEYGSFAAEFTTGRPFILNQPIVASSTPGSSAAIQSALDRVAPGYGGDQPETDIEALYQLVTGAGFDGNANGSVLDSGPAGLASTQTNPGISGDVPSFASFAVDTAHGGIAPSGNVGGGGFRAGALPIVLLATDTGFAYQPKGETSILGTGGVSLPLTSLTQLSRGTTPFSSGAGIQETVTGLNALGALVIGLGTNPLPTIDPRQGLEALSTLTGAVNRSTATIANGTPDAIAPGDPLYFQIGAGFGTTVADGVINAIQNAVTNVALDVTVRASDPRVHIINHTGMLTGVGAGQTASFDLEFTGDGKPHRFDIEFVRAGTNVVLGSIPVVLGTPVVGEGYSYDELEDGEIHQSSHFGNYVANIAPSFFGGSDITVTEDAGVQTVTSWATSISAGPAVESRQTVDFIVTNDNPYLFSAAPAIASDGTLTFTPAPNANGNALVIVQAHDNGGVGLSGADTSLTQTFVIAVTAVNDAPVAADDTYNADSNSSMNVVAASGLLGNDSDIDNATISAQLAVGPTHGSVSILADGSFSYTPNVGFAGFDSFTYTANDGSLDSNLATVSIKVTGVNSAPVAVDDSFSVAEDGVLTQLLPGVLGNDTDLDGDLLTAIALATTAHGTLVFNPNGSFVYTPVANYNGADSFTYKANDGRVDSNVATVALNVTAINDAPVAVGESFSATEDTTLSIVAPGVLSNDSDIDGDALQAFVVTGPTHGTLSLGAAGSITYTPALNYNGPDSFTYKATDGLLSSNVVTVAISVAAVNDVPVANNDSVSTNQNTAVNVPARGVLLNDTDADGDALTASVQTGPANGVLTLNADGSYRYTPNLNFTGTDTFTYRASDAVSFGVATVTVTVIPVVLPTKFFVADATAGATFKYAADGSAISNFALDKSGNKPRGIASNSTGTTQWVIDSSGTVYVYNNSGALLGSWQPQNVGKPEGITVWGNDLWLVDPTQDKVFKFVGGALLRTGRVSATSNFALNSGNLNSTDIVTDGAHLWVVNDIVGVDKVFRYTTAGVLEGSWALSSTDPSPTGITLDPNNLNHVWVVDASTRRVYQYDGGTALLTGSKEPSISFALSATDTNPQGIADPDSAGSTSSKPARASHNFLLPNDANDDGEVSPLDALAVINDLNRGADDSSSVEAQFHDVDDDSLVTPLDALVLINALNAKAANPTQPIVQSSEIKNSLTGARVRAELDIESGQTELQIRIDNAPKSTSFPVTLNDIALGQIMTDSRGRGTLILGQGDDNEQHLPLPQGFTTLSPDMELIIGDLVHGQLSQVAKVETTTPSVPSVNLKLAARFDIVAGAVRSMEYEQEIESGVSKRKLVATIEKAAPSTSFDVSVAGIVVGKITTDSKGKGTLRLSSLPKDASELLFPNSFPTVGSSTAVAIGAIGSTLR